MSDRALWFNSIEELVMQSSTKAADYGESDIEAKAMTQASEVRPPPQQLETAEAIVQAGGTTETDIKKNLREKRRRERND